MDVSAGDEFELKPGGVAIAAVAFVLTRTFIVEAFYVGSDATPLEVGVSLLPLVLGLGIAVFGVSLAVSTHSREYVRTVAAWCLGSIAGMALLVGLGALAAGVPIGEIPTNNLVTTSVIGGGVGGVFLGVQSAQERRQRRQLRQRADQATLLNRLLRHEILNGLTAIRGHAALLGEGTTTDASWEAVENNSERIERTVEDVKILLPTGDDSDASPGAVEVGPILRRCRDSLSDGEHTLVLPEDLPEVTVRGDDGLETALGELASRALERTPDSRASVSVSVGETAASLAVSGSGEWLTGPEREALLEGLPEYDDPRVGYGIPITRLLVARYGGTLSVTDRGDATEVTVELPLAGGESSTLHSHGVDGATLRNAAVVGLVSGLAMGAVLQAFSGEIAIIGGLYGVSTAPVGWIVHLFHSVVFATLAVAARRRPLIRRYTSSLGGAVAAGVIYSLLLWLFAAGLVMPVWLALVGIPIQIPHFGTVSLVAHLIWGVTLGGLVRFLVVPRPDWWMRFRPAIV